MTRTPSDAPKISPPTSPAKLAKQILKPVKVEFLPEESEFNEEPVNPMEEIKSEITEDLIYPDLSESTPPESRRKLNAVQKRKLYHSKDKENQSLILPDAPRLFPPTVPLQLQCSGKFKEGPERAVLNPHRKYTEKKVPSSYSNIPKVLNLLESSRLRRALEAINYLQPSENTKKRYPQVLDEMEMQQTKKKSRSELLSQCHVLPDAPILFDPVPPQQISRNYGDLQKSPERSIRNTLDSQS